MINFLDETLATLVENNKTIDDIVAICGDDFRITKEDFYKYADTNYDNGFGGAEVAIDLKIIGADFWLERVEHDGAEWWEFKEFPKYEKLPIKSVKALTIGQANRNGLKRISDDKLICLQRE